MEEKKSYEHLEEGWVRFTRHYFKTGHIDVYQGDQGENPNLDKRPNISLNAFLDWFRLDDKWLPADHFKKGFLDNIIEFKDLNTAENFWNFFLKYNYKIKSL